MISRNFLLSLALILAAHVVYAPWSPIETDWQNKFKYTTEKNNGIIHSYNYDSDLYSIENEPVKYGFNKSQNRYFIQGTSPSRVMPSQDAIKAVYDSRKARFDS